MKHKLGKVMSMAWLFFLILAILFGYMNGYSRNTSLLDATSTPYHVTIITSNFRIAQLSASADDVSNPQHVLFHLQNGTSLWYGISMTSTPAGIIPLAATPSDIVSTTFLNAVPLLPPAQVLPLDSWNGIYHFQTLQLGVSFTGPGQQFQLTLSPTEPHAVTLDIITMLLHLLGLHSEGTQIGLLENGLLSTIFTATGGMKDFESLVQNYSQVLTGGTDTTQPLTYAYACALDLSNLLSDNSEQTTLADVLWRIEGKAISRDSILQSIIGFSQAQSGLAIEGYIKGQATMFAPMLSGVDSPKVELQTMSNAVSDPTHGISVTVTTSLTAHATASKKILVTPTPKR